MFRLMDRDQNWSDRDWCSWLESVFARQVEELPTGSTVALTHIGFCWFGSMRNETLQLLSPKDQAREFRPCVNLHPQTETSSASVELCLFPAHPTYWHKRVTSEKESSRSPAKSES